jgi:hypothetical protein
MQCTADFHHHITHPVFPHPDGLFEHAAAFDTAINMFDAHPAPRDLPVVRFLYRRQLFPARLLCRLEDLHALQREPLKAQVLQQLTPSRQWIRGRIGQALVVDAPRMGLTQEHDAQRGVDQQQVFQHMPLFLAAITRLLFSRVCGARDGSLGAIMTKRGAASGGAAWTASDGADAKGTGGHSPPRRARKASTLRQGASPKVRKVLRSTGSKT